MKYLFLVYLILKTLTEDEDIYFVLNHFRHGIRSPLKLDEENKDTFGNEWSNGPGELTLNGIRQHYLIGITNKNKYKNLLNFDYKSKEILVYSTNLNRTIMSAQAQLSGMYNNIHYDFKLIKGENKLPYNLSNIYYDENFNYYPVPIHNYEERRINNKIKMVKVMDYLWVQRCKRNLEKRKKNMNNKTLTENKVNYMLEKYYNNINKSTSIEENFQNIFIFCDAIISNYYENRIIEEYKDNIEEVKKDCFDFESFKQIEIEQSYYAKDTGIYTMSLMIENILNWMEYRVKYNTLNATSGFPKYVMYSGHDSTLIAMQRYLKDSLNINFNYTPFASSQYFELKKNNNNNLFFVEIYYNNEKVYRDEFSEFEKKVKKILIPHLNVVYYCEGINYDVKISIFLICLFLFLFIVSVSLINLFMQKLKGIKNYNHGDIIGNPI